LKLRGVRTFLGFEREFVAIVELELAGTLEDSSAGIFTAAKSATTSSSISSSCSAYQVCRCSSTIFLGDIGILCLRSRPIRRNEFSLGSLELEFSLESLEVESSLGSLAMELSLDSLKFASTEDELLIELDDDMEEFESEKYSFILHFRCTNARRMTITSAATTKSTTRTMAVTVVGLSLEDEVVDEPLLKVVPVGSVTDTEAFVAPIFVTDDGSSGIGGAEVLVEVFMTSILCLETWSMGLFRKAVWLQLNSKLNGTKGNEGKSLKMRF
jgi:hypothetical protein